VLWVLVSFLSSIVRSGSIADSVNADIWRGPGLNMFSDPFDRLKNLFTGGSLVQRAAEVEEVAVVVAVAVADLDVMLLVVLELDVEMANLEGDVMLDVDLYLL
jgi:hypothetical protein